MVEAAQHLGNHWHISPAITGTLILDMLTSIPNALAAIRLSRHGRGPAVVAETFTSNSANILAGICLAAAILGLGTISHQAQLTAWWLLLMTAAAVALLWIHYGLNCTGAIVIILSYTRFVVLILTRAQPGCNQQRPGTGSSRDSRARIGRRFTRRTATRS